MKNRKLAEMLGEFMLGKGFYIVLFLCVATIGISGYYLFRTTAPTQEQTQTTVGDTTVVLPDSEANGPDPVGRPSEPSTQPDSQPQRPTVSTPAEEPEPVAEPVEEPEQSAAVTVPRPEDMVCTWPVKGEILRDFSVETLSLDPTLGDWRTHGGLDIAAETGVRVLAMGPGVVSRVYDDGLMGTTVMVDHGNGVHSLYCNLAGEPAVQQGDVVETGTILGAVGTTAIAESGLVSHLHLEVWNEGVPTDPREFLPAS